MTVNFLCLCFFPESRDQLQPGWSQVKVPPSWETASSFPETTYFAYISALWKGCQGCQSAYPILVAQRNECWFALMYCTSFWELFLLTLFYRFAFFNKCLCSSVHLAVISHLLLFKVIGIFKSFKGKFKSCELLLHHTASQRLFVHRFVQEEEKGARHGYLNCNNS